jgi:hypothetical protein
VLQLVCWLTYLTVVLAVFLRPVGDSPARQHTPQSPVLTPERSAS